MTNSALPERRPNGTLLPGNSLNPSGRPAIVAEVQSLARAHAPAAFARIVALVDSPDERTALAAAQEVLNRGFGKPMQQVKSETKTFNMAALFAMAAAQGKLEPEGGANTVEATVIDAELVSSSDVMQQEPPSRDIRDFEW